MSADAFTFFVVLFHPVITAIVRNRQDFIKQSVDLFLTRMRVLVRKAFVLTQPLENRGMCRKAFLIANGAQTIAIGYALTYCVYQCLA